MQAADTDVMAQPSATAGATASALRVLASLFFIWGFITVINGTRAGAPGDPDPPGIAVFGGTHGDEYEGQIAVTRLCRDLDPARIRGRVVLIPQLSESACRAHQRAMSSTEAVNRSTGHSSMSRSQ